MDQPSRIDQLGPKELACLRKAAEHKGSKEIARELALSPSTVDTYIWRATKKLGLARREDAVRWLLQHDSELWRFSQSDISDVEGAAAVGPTSLLSRLPWPWPTRRRPSNDLTPMQLVIAVLIASICVLAVAALYLTAVALLRTAA
jgi:DNA-binding CsgD family transcriptional regulator